MSNNIQVTRYGTYTKGISFNSSSQRVDKWTSHDGETSHEPIICHGLTDNSDVYNGKYDPLCSACWLGYGHTENKHNESLKPVQN